MLTIETTTGPGGTKELEYILKNKNSLIYTSPQYIELVSRHLGAECYWLSAKRNNKTIALFPYMVKHGPLGLVFNSLPYYGSNGGVIQDEFDEDVICELIQRYYNDAYAANACSATIITNPLEQDHEVYEYASQYDFLDERIGQITHLPESIEVNNLMKMFDDPRPRNIRRAIKEGVKVERSQDLSAIDYLFTTHVKNMDAIGGTPKEERFFYDIPKFLPRDSWAIHTAKLDNKAIAALLTLYFNQTVEYFTPVIDLEYRKTQALALTIYKSMQEAILAGYRNWNWGGTWLSQGGVYDFKKKWGMKEYNYYYYTRVFENSVKENERDFFLNHYNGFYVIPFQYLQS